MFASMRSSANQAHTWSWSLVGIITCSYSVCRHVSALYQPSGCLACTCPDKPLYTCVWTKAVPGIVVSIGDCKLCGEVQADATDESDEDVGTLESQQAEFRRSYQQGGEHQQSCCHEAVGQAPLSFAMDKALNSGGPNREGHLFKEESIALPCQDSGSSAKPCCPRADIMVRSF